jgi:regulator of cell morphogenesis and NO signaling
MQITETACVGDVAAAHPATIKVFQRNNLDFCCGGKRPLGEVCREASLDFEGFRAELEATIAGAPAEGRDFRSMQLDELVEFIVSRYHVSLREELPRLAQMMEKVLGVHGGRHSELQGVSRTLAAIQEDLDPHMIKEEQVLFPYIRSLALASTAGCEMPDSPFRTVRNPIRIMELEHEAVGGLLVQLRQLTSGYVAPQDACNTFRGLYHGFAELERELHEHIHLENNVLHPRAAALEARLQERVA